MNIKKPTSRASEVMSGSGDSNRTNERISTAVADSIEVKQRFFDAHVADVARAAEINGGVLTCIANDTGFVRVFNFCELKREHY